MRRFIRLVACAIVAATLCADYSSAQAPEQEIANRTLSLHMDDAYLMRVLSTLSVDHRVPIGLEVADDDADEPKLSIDINNAPLKDVLDLITRQYPAYRWEVRDNVVNFVPVQSRDQLLSKALGTHITRFAPKKGLNKFGIRDTIIGLPEVTSFLNAYRLTAWQQGYPTYPSIYTNDEVDLSISDTDLRGVLNKVVRDSEHKLWVIKRKGKQGKILQIDF